MATCIYAVLPGVVISRVIRAAVGNNFDFIGQGG
jgi:hypothetical protein